MSELATVQATDATDVTRSGAVQAALPEGYLVGQALTAEDARALTDHIHTAMGVTQELLRIAFVGRAHEALGFGRGLAGWEAYFAKHFAGYVVALPAEQRRLQVKAWMAVGASVRVIGIALDASAGTISGDRKALGGPTSTGESLDGRQRDAAAASAKAVEAAKAAPKRRATPLTSRVETMLLAAGRDGLTSAEARKNLKLHHGQVSAVFTALDQQRRIHRTTERRSGYGVYLHPEFLVIDAEVVED